LNALKAVFGKKGVQAVVWRKGLEAFLDTFEHHTSMKRPPPAAGRSPRLLAPLRAFLLLLVLLLLLPAT